MGKLPRAQVTLPAIDEREAAEALRAALGILFFFFVFFFWGGLALGLIRRIIYT